VSGCPARVRKALLDVGGLTVLDVDFDKKTATFQTTLDPAAARDACEKALKEAGYGVSAFAETAAGGDS
jgi:copper chaperone CopZ